MLGGRSWRRIQAFLLFQLFAAPVQASTFFDSFSLFDGIANDVKGFGLGLLVMLVLVSFHDFFVQIVGRLGRFGASSSRRSRRRW